MNKALRKYKDARNWLRCRLHPEYRHHVIRTGLEPGWHDEDTLILHGCMAMLCRYIRFHGEADLERFNVELRNPENDPNAPIELKSGQADLQEEALAIYRWWKVQKPKDQQRRDELLHKVFGRKEWNSPLPDELKPDYHEFQRLEEKIADDEQKMLHRLIDIRPGLWT